MDEKRRINEEQVRNDRNYKAFMVHERKRADMNLKINKDMVLNNMMQNKFHNDVKLRDRSEDISSSAYLNAVEAKPYQQNYEDTISTLQRSRLRRDHLLV